MTRPRRIGNPRARDRQAGAADRDDRYYDRLRRKQLRRRQIQDRAAFDPSPPDDDDWTVGDEDTDAVYRLSRPTSVNETLQELVRRRGWEERLQGASAWARWDVIVGEDLAARCEPVRLRDQVLTVRAVNQTWATQLRYMIPHLISNVEASLGERTVREVRIVVGSLEGRERPQG